MKYFVARLVRDEAGATAIEYGLIAALIGIALIGAARAIDTQIGATFSTVLAETQKSGGRTP